MFALLDEAIEWAEDQIIFRYGGYIGAANAAHIKEQALLAGLSDQELADLTALGTARAYSAGQRIIATGEPASVAVFSDERNGERQIAERRRRLAGLDEGMAFGQMTLLDEPRTADVLGRYQCPHRQELPGAEFNRFRNEHPQIASFAISPAILAKRLILANAKVDLLSAY